MSLHSPHSIIVLSLVLATLFAGGIVVTPLLQAAGITAGDYGRLLYTPICHQLANRSLMLDGHPLGVCARCTGLYTGGLVGLWLGFASRGLRRRRPGPVWLLLVSLPSLHDVALPVLGFAGASNVPRFLMALAPGLLAGIYLAIGIHDLVTYRSSQRSRPARTTGPVLEGSDG